LWFFASKAFGENNLDKTKTYFKELLKYKYYLLASTSFLIVTGGYFLAKYYYAKPIYYALLAGAIYIPVVGIISYLTSAFQVENNYRYPMYKEVIFQIIRFTVVPLGILFLLKDGITNSALMGMIILLLSFSYLVGFLYLIITAKQKIKFLRAKERKLTHKEKMQLKDFILPLSLTALGGIVFGYIDTLMLGHYVTAGFIGYYSAAFGLIGAASAIMGFLSGGALPVFSQEKKKDLESTFKKIRNIILLIGTASFVFTLLIAKYILLIYGSDYGPATTILRILAILLITGPIVQIYNSYFISIKKPEVIAKILILSTLINIVLNVGLINYGISVGGMIGGCYGAAIATIIARGFYLVEIIIIKKKLC